MLMLMFNVVHNFWGGNPSRHVIRRRGCAREIEGTSAERQLDDDLK